MFPTLPCYWWTKKKGTVSCSFAFTKLEIARSCCTFRNVRGGENVTVLFSDFCPTIPRDCRPVDRYDGREGVILFRRAAADTEYSHGTGWSHEEEKLMGRGGDEEVLGGLPRSAGISRLCILERVTMRANSSSCTLSLNSVLPRTIWRLGSTIFRTSTWEIRT